MRTRPPQVTDAHIERWVVDHWALPPVTAVYEPVGFGSHHWVLTAADGQRWFATLDVVDDPAAARLRESLTAAVTARDAGLDFVVAPLATRAGEPLVQAEPHLALAVYPHLVGASGGFDDALDTATRRELASMLAALHAVAPLPRCRSEDFRIPGRRALERVVGRLRDGSTGPRHGAYGVALDSALRTHADGVVRALAEHDRLVAAAGEQRSRMVLTHGEPHPGNLVRTADGPRLVDWDTAMIGPPERDLWLVDARSGGAASAEYAAATGRRLLPELMERYALAWALADVADFVDTLASAATRTEDTDWAWEALLGTLRDLDARFG